VTTGAGAVSVGFELAEVVAGSADFVGDGAGKVGAGAPPGEPVAALASSKGATKIATINKIANSRYNRIV